MSRCPAILSLSTNNWSDPIQLTVYLTTTHDHWDNCHRVMFINSLYPKSWLHHQFHFHHYNRHEIIEDSAVFGKRYKRAKFCRLKNLNGYTGCRVRQWKWWLLVRIHSISYSSWYECHWERFCCIAAMKSQQVHHPFKAYNETGCLVLTLSLELFFFFLS